jgi:hypothetical protein
MSLRRFFKTSCPSLKSARPTLQPSFRPLLEALEDRTTPSILFAPQNGAENATNGGGSILGQSSWGVPIYTIYWGSYWGTSAGAAYANSIQNSINSMFYYSPYLDGLHQYGTSYRAGVSTTGTVQVFNYSDPATVISSQNVKSVVENAIVNQGLPESDDYSNEGIYVVFTPPGTSIPGLGGDHFTDSDYDFPFDFDTTVEAWVGTNGGLDVTTKFFSHEVAEAITDPHGDAWQVDPRNSTNWNEIGDNEAQNYAYRLNGYLMQAYWSQSDKAYLVPDGNYQQFWVNNGTLNLYGDQFGANWNDNISIDVNSSGGVYVNMNGEVASFDPGQINFINVYARGGNNTINVYNTNVPVYIQSGGTDTVNLGNGYDGVQGIRANVNITNPPAYTTLNINDGADTGGHTAYVTNGYVYGLAPGTIYYNQYDVSALNIYGGKGGNTFDVQSTPSNGHGVSTYLNSGTYIDLVNVQATNGPLYLDGSSGGQIVTVGSLAPSFGGTLANINGDVVVYNSSSSGSSALYVDDSGDATGRTVSMNDGSITGMAPAGIYWTDASPSTTTGGVDFLEVLGGKGFNTFNVYGVSNFGYSTTLETGTGGATVNVQRTSGPLNVDNNGGTALVNIGSAAPSFGGTQAGILGSVDVYGTGSTSLFVDDSGDTSSHIAYLTATSLTGLSPAPIYWTASPSATGGVTSLTILGSAAGSTYNVLNTPNLHFNTELDTGAGPDMVLIDATTGRLDVFNRGGQDYVYVGNGTLAGINGNVSVEGAGSTWLYVEDHSDTTAHSATLTDKQLRGLSNGVISWNASSSPTGGVTYLEIDGSAAASTYRVTNTPNLYYGTYLDLGASGTDLVYVLGTAGRLNVLNGVGAHAEVVVETGLATGSINGLVDVYGAGDTYLYVEDFNTSAPRTTTLTATSLTGLSTGPIEWTASSSPTGGVTALVIYGSAANTTFHVTGIPNLYYGTVIFGGSGTNTLIGPNSTNTWSITGAHAGSLNGTVGFSGIANLVGGTGVDTFRFSAAASQVASINGGGAPAGQGDWLDYTAFPAAVAVNLSSTTVNRVKPNSATGVTGTVQNIQNVFGGNFGNTLIGDAQGNILIGGTGADHIFGGHRASLLIGGKGNDTVVGGSGGDILIGGFTTYDQTHNEMALMSILAEWQSSKPYLTRVKDLKVGSNPLILGTTVIDDGGNDSLTGGSFIPGALDWFFKGLHDTIHHYEGGEQIN